MSMFKKIKDTFKVTGRIPFGLAFFVFVVMVVPVSAVDYNPGVTVGQFAEYSTTYESDIPEPPGIIDDRPYWFKLEVVSVSGKKVTIQLFAKTKNDSILEGSGNNFVLDVENGAIDDMFSSGGPLGVCPRFLLMAGNMAYSDTSQKLFEVGWQPFLSFEKNEMRTYLGFNRNVNIFIGRESHSYNEGNETAQWTVEYNITETIVFDKVTGVFLEAEWDSRETSPESVLILRVRSTLIDTNIFETPPTAVTLNTPSQNEIGTSSVVLGWTASPDTDFSKYEVYMSSSSTQLGSLVTTINTKAITTYTVTNLSPTTTYYYTVRVYNTGNLYADSNKLTVTTATEPPFYTQLWFIALIVVIIVIIIAIVALTMRKKNVSSINQSG